MTSITITVPDITAVTIAPNPVNFNGSYKISLAVTERTIVLYPEERYAGEFYCGEV